MNFLIGADPELFVEKDGMDVSGHGMVEGTKANPFKVDNGAVQVDGMALEFNIDPADSADKFVHHLSSVMAQLKSMVKGYDVVAKPVAFFGHDYIEAQPDEAKELGCDPDYNAWNGGKENKKPNVDAPFRTAAGHVHIGWTQFADISSVEHQLTCQELVKQLDFCLGLPSLFYDDDTKRRELYGKAGAYRPKPYGVEYRTLSNCWLRTENLMRWVYAATEDAILRLMNGENLAEKYGDVQNIINTSDKDAAMEIIKKAKLIMPC